MSPTRSPGCSGSWQPRAARGPTARAAARQRLEQLAEHAVRVLAAIDGSRSRPGAVRPAGGRAPLPGSAAPRSTSWRCSPRRPAAATTRSRRCASCARRRTAHRPPSRIARDRASSRCDPASSPHGVRLPLRQGEPPAGHRLQRRRAPAGHELLRPARLRGAARAASSRSRRGSCRRRAGSPWGACSRRRRRAGPPLLERLDVRVPDAAAGDADVRAHAARPDLQGGGRPADRVREEARRALGHLGIRLQHDRRPPQLPVPRLRRARPGAQARAGRRPGRRALRLGAGADGGARGGVPEPAAARRGGLRRAATASTRRSTTRPSRLPRGQSQRRDPLLHGAPPGHEPCSPWPTCSWTVRCRSGSSRTRCSRRPRCCSRSGCRGPRGSTAQTADALRLARGPRRGGGRRARRSAAPDTPLPEVQLLSNGRYHVMVTNAGGGYSRWKDLAVTRWREDGTRDDWGTFCYLRDVASGEFWSTAYQPTLKRSKQLRGDLLRGAGGVPPPRPRLRHAHRDRRLARGRHRAAPDHDHQPRPDAPGDRGHELRGGRPRAARRGRAASRVQQPLRPDGDRRAPAGDPLHPPAPLPRRADAVDVPPDGRARGGSRRGLLRDRPAAVHRPRQHASPTRRRWAAPGGALSGSEGSVLDPIVAIRYRMTLDPEQSATINVVTGVGETRDVCLGLVEKYQDRHLADRVFDLAWTHSQVLLRQINATEADAQLYGRLAGSVIYANASLRADPGMLAANRRGPVRPLGLRHLRRPADRAAADRRPGQHRPGAPARPGPRLLAPEGAGGRPGDLERGSRRLPAAAARADHGTDRRRRRGERDRPAGRHLRAAGGPDLGRGPHPAPDGRPRHHHRQPRHRSRSRSTAAARAPPRRAAPGADPEPPRRIPAPPRRRRAATCSSSTGSEDSRPTAASTSSRPRPGRSRRRRG